MNSASARVRTIFVALAAAGLSIGSAAVAASEDIASATSHQVDISFVDNFTAEFAVPPDFLWEELKRMYVEGSKYRDLGFAIEQIEPNPTAWLGGTVATKNVDGQVDQREAHFTTIDDEHQFMSIRVVYNSGLSAFASYDVRPTETGSLMQLIVHAQQPVSVEGEDSLTAAAVREAAENLVQYHYDQLARIWAADIARIEALYKVGRSEE